MRVVDGVLVAGALSVAILQSPAARTVAGRCIAGSARTVAPAAARAGRAAAGRAGRAAAGRAGAVREWARPSPGGAVACPRQDCDWWQASPSLAEMLTHLRTEHGRGRTTTPAAAPAEAAAKPAAPPVDARPAERFVEVAPGVRIGHQIDQVINTIGVHMDEFRAVTRSLAAAGEVEPKSLLALLDTLGGVLATIAGTANLITDVAEHADTEMWIDLRAVGPLYEAASGVMAESETVRRAMERIRALYAEEIEVEHKREDGKVRQLNPKVINHAAA